MIHLVVYTAWHACANFECKQFAHHRQCTHYFRSFWLIFASFVCNCASKSINYYAQQLNCMQLYTRTHTHTVTEHIDNDSTYFGYVRKSPHKLYYCKIYRAQGTELKLNNTL